MRAIVAGFGAWTLFVWVTRLRNIASDSLTGASLIISVGSALLFVGLALVMLAALAGKRPDVLAKVTPVLAAYTTAVWAYRVVDIVADGEHGTAFKVVHAALGIVSVAVAAAAFKQVRATPEVPVTVA